MTHVLTMEFGKDETKTTVEVHLLNVGEMFPADFDPEKFNGFGGSRHPLIAGRDFATGEKQKKPTASLVVRTRSPMGVEDKERDINDPHFWAWMAKLINADTAPPNDQPFASVPLPTN